MVLLSGRGRVLPTTIRRPLWFFSWSQISLQNRLSPSRYGDADDPVLPMLSVATPLFMSRNGLVLGHSAVYQPVWRRQRVENALCAVCHAWRETAPPRGSCALR